MLLVACGPLCVVDVCAASERLALDARSDLALVVDPAAAAAAAEGLLTTAGFAGPLSCPGLSGAAGDGGLLLPLSPGLDGDGSGNWLNLVTATDPLAVRGPLPPGPGSFTSTVKLAVAAVGTNCMPSSTFVEGGQHACIVMRAAGQQYA